MYRQDRNPILGMQNILISHRSANTSILYLVVEMFAGEVNDFMKVIGC